MASAALGMVVANSPLADDYVHILHTKLGGLDVLHWINDGLMALFFLLVGLEIKREMVEGELDTWPSRTLPLIAALGGMVVPALVYFAVNFRSPENWQGWAIPTATDIAFALGVLALWSSRVPSSLKVFLTSLAIMDDLGAILIIALFYASNLSGTALCIGAALAAVLLAFNQLGVTRLWPYLAVGAALWSAILFSGIHATLAGVVLALTIPVQPRDEEEHSPLNVLEDGLGRWVGFIVLPLFGFANAGVPLGGMSLDNLLAPLSLGIVLGLFAGKQIGIMGTILIARRAGIVRLPPGASWRQVYGVAILCGIGFTMSLFIGLLAFDAEASIAATKLAVLVGSLLSAIVGALVLMQRRDVQAGH